MVVNRSAAPGVLSLSSYKEKLPTWWSLWRDLDSTRSCQATDLRVKVFALKALIGPGSISLDHIIDYFRSLESVLAAVTKYLLPIIGLTLLLAVRHPHGRVGLASWVPDWSQTQPLWGLDAFGLAVRKAMGNTKKGYVNERPNELVPGTYPALINLLRYL